VTDGTHPWNFAVEEDDAKARFKDWGKKDPYVKEVKPALLNSADLLHYIDKTGMICPFELPERPSDRDKRVKPASVAIPVLGPYVYWDEPDPSVGDERPIKRSGELREGEELKIKPNSIVFVTLRPTFRLPDYIAARFNLKIRDVYRGLLVGTGPLVDPGFVGRLSIPLHNLTDNEYTLVGGDDLLWMEFTKLSPHRRWTEGIASEDDGYVPFPADKIERKKVDDYLRHADPRPIRSSIPPLVGRAQQSAEEARGEARNIRRIITFTGLAGVIGVILAVVSVWALVWSVNDSVSDVERTIAELRQQVNEQRQELGELRGQLPDGARR
jgi:deoxycytidine triphosphate deaminase/cell division protein FtsL